MAEVDQQSFEKDLEDQVRPLMEALHIPGVAIGIVHGRFEFRSAYGVTNIEHPLDVTPDTLFQIGSITKTYTATALMRLVEQGRLDLDEPIKSYLPDFSLKNSEWAGIVTTRHLLNHTAGWEGDFLLSHPVGGRGDEALEQAVLSMPQVPLLTHPGTVYHYNNAGFSVAGRLIEVLTNKTYENALKSLVLKRLRLGNTFLFAEDVFQRRVANGHTHTSTDDVSPAPFWAPRCLSSTGAVISSVNDLIEYARFHLGLTESGSNAILSPESLKAMQSPQFTVGDYPSAVGLSWMICETERSRILSHVGSTSGQFAIMQLLPDHDLAVIVLTNADSGLILVRQIASWVSSRLAGVETEIPEPIDVENEQLAQYVGSYVGEMFSVDVSLSDTQHLEASIRLGNGFDRWDASGLPSVPITFHAVDVGIVREGFFATMQPRFMRNENGTIQWLRFNERLHYLQAE